MNHKDAFFNAMHSIRILVVGDVMLDEYVITRVDRLSPEAPVPVASVVEREHRLGGAANVAHNLAALGCSVSLLGLVGDDAPAATINSLLMAAGIQSLLVRDQQRPTTVKTRITAMGHQLLRIDVEDTLPLAPDMLETLLDQYTRSNGNFQAIVLSDYAKGVFRRLVDNRSLSEELIRLCNNAVPILVDPKSDDWMRYAGATCVTPNMVEFRLVVDDAGDNPDSLAHSCRKLRERFNLQYVLLTRSEKGMLLLDQSGEAFFIDTVAAGVVDVTGAGDTVMAVLAACAGAGLPMLQAAQIANAAAGIVVGKSGTSVVTRDELRTVLERMECML